MALTNPSLPGIRQPLLEGAAASRPYYLFLQWMATNVPAVAAQVDGLTARVDAITGGGSGDAANITGRWSIQTYGSLAAGIVQISLEGDTAAPGNTQYYGSDTSGTKGWFPVASALAGSTNVGLSTGTDGVTTFDLADLTDSGAGALLAITRDAKGRVSGTKAATITGTAGQIDVTNGDASAGLPTISLDSSITALLALLSAIAPTLRADDAGDYRVTDSGIYRVTA